MGGRHIKMEILIIADIHGYFAGEKILDLTEKRKISDIFILGDFSPHGHIGDLEGIEDFLKIGCSKKIYAIPGNCDGKEILKIFDKFNGNYHEKIANIENTDFIFFGGSNITPFNTIFEYTEDEIYDKLKGLFEISKSKRKILLTHCPPFNTNCDLTIRGHVGSRAIRRIIEEFQPEINFCSHVHECYGKVDFIMKTKIISVGELRRGCAILKFNENFDVERINF